MPLSPGPRRTSLRLPRGAPSLPSVPMKFCTLPQIETSSGLSAWLVTTKRSTATGSALASRSQGTSGLNACSRTDTGTSGSSSTTWPNG